MNQNASTGNPRGKYNSYRQEKSNLLKGFAIDLENNTLPVSEQKRLIAMLNKSAQNLMETNDQWMLEDNTLKEITESLTETFFLFQDVFDCIDADDFDNEWRCDFSNRIMHKSMKLQNFKKHLIQIQKSIYHSMGDLVGMDPLKYLTDKTNGELELRDFRFYVNNGRQIT